MHVNVVNTKPLERSDPGAIANVNSSDVSVESLRKFLASISTEDDVMRCPTLEALLTLEI